MNNTPPKKLKSIRYSLDGKEVELIPKSGITNYIKERIETLRKEEIGGDSIDFIRLESGIVELQAVLSKLEELGK